MCLCVSRYLLEHLSRTCPEITLNREARVKPNDILSSGFSWRKPPPRIHFRVRRHDKIPWFSTARVETSKKSPEESHCTRREPNDRTGKRSRSTLTRTVTPRRHASQKEASIHVYSCVQVWVLWANFAQHTKWFALLGGQSLLSSRCGVKLVFFVCIPDISKGLK